VIHVGANTGQERELYNQHQLNVLWVEPIDTIFKQLQDNIRPYEKQKAVQALLMDHSGQDTVLKVANNGGASSSIFDLGQHKEMWPEVEYCDSRVIMSTTLDILVAVHEGDTSVYDTLVLDVQGAEMLVLKGAEAILDQIEFIQAEAADFKMYDGEAGIRELIEYLDGKGFSEIARHRLAGDGVGNNCYEIFFRNRKNRK
jgi:FkbM family methyltransferase